jgi:Xaa-Pro aminopeptidase
VQPMEYSGKSFDDKIEDLRKELEKKKSLGFVVSMLDEVAWLFNLRGNEYASLHSLATNTC